jgi:hypothetical protein
VKSLPKKILVFPRDPSEKDRLPTGKTSSFLGVNFKGAMEKQKYLIFSKSNFKQGKSQRIIQRRFPKGNL